MKALIYRQFGRPDVLEWADDWPEPMLPADAIRVAIEAGSINKKDSLLRKGFFSRTLARDPLPRVSGLDGAGVVTEVGAGVSDLSVGDRVMGMTNNFCGGVHAEQAVFHRDEVARVPDALTLVEAAAIPLAALTSLQALRNLGQLRAGQRVLVNGASGGVGHFAVQIARALGAEVEATCGEHNLDFVRDLGAEVVHDYRQTPADAIDGRFDVVYDGYGNFSFSQMAAQLGDSGVYISTVPNLKTIFAEGVAKLGLSRRDRLVIVKSKAKDLELLAEWAEKGLLKPVVGATYPFAEAAAGHQHIERLPLGGKVVLTQST